MTQDDKEALQAAEETVVELLGVLGIEIPEQAENDYPPEVLDLARDLAGYTGRDPAAAVNGLLATREVARTERNWGLADAVRDGLMRLGFTIEDTPQGARVTYSG